jgi:hypothetical protein
MLRGRRRYVAKELFDLSGDLVGFGDRNAAFNLSTGRGDEFAYGGRPYPSDRPKPSVPRDMFTPDLRIDALKVQKQKFTDLRLQARGRRFGIGSTAKRWLKGGSRGTRLCGACQDWHSPHPRIGGASKCTPQ